MTLRFLGAGGAVFGGVLTIGSLVTLWYDIPAGSVVLGADQPVAQRAGDLDAPVPVTAGGEPIDVEGYAAPFVGDFDGDGRNDLLVGQYVYGRLRVYRNAGTNAEPKFDRFEWFTVDGLPACVPSGCYVGFTPQLFDFDGDGRVDILSGSFPGVLLLFRRIGDGTFAQAEVVRDKHGEIQFGYPDRRRHNSTVFAHDWDQDGKPDLLLGRHIYSLVPNEGSREKPVFGDALPLKVNGEKIPNGIVPPCVADWDGDARDDLIIGRGDDIVWYRNVGERGRPALAAPQILVPDNNKSSSGEEPVGSEPRRFQAVCVADFNGDGRQDLLVGDNFVTAKEVPEPPAKQGRKDPETTKAWNDHWSEVTRLSGTRSHVENVQEQNEGWRKLVVKWQQLAANDPDGTQATSSNVRRHGRVWLYQRH